MERLLASSQQSTPGVASKSVSSAPASPESAHLRRQLTAGQMSMVAVGGSIGTGLLLGSGAAIQIAGPGVIISYIIGTCIAFVVTMALGEMACRHPGAGSFGIYADLYVGEWAGFIVRNAYWFSIMISVSGELVAAATYTRFWLPQVPALVWIAVYAALLLFINLRQVGDFGAFEYWFAMIKVVIIFIFVLLGTALLVGHKVQAQYTSDGGFLPHGAAAPLLALSFPLFSFLGTEMIAISSEEAASIANIRRATYITFAPLAFLYLGATVVLTGILPWSQAGVTESPFVTVFAAARLPAVRHIMNFVVLTAALSGSNASLYVTSRMLYSLAQSGYAPRRLTRLDSSGAPRWSVLASTVGILVALVVEYFTPANAFLYIIGASLFGGMLAWGIALASHIAMRRRISPADLAALPMRAPGGVVASALALAGIIAAVVLTWWVPQARITAVTGPPYLLLLFIFYLFMKKSRLRNTISP